MEAQLEDVRRRLHKFYDALETGKLEVEDLAPRIKELKAQTDDLEQKRVDLTESIREAKVDLLEASVVKAYVDDLKALLSKGSIVEQKSFLRSFVRRIEVNLPQATVNYTLPLIMQKVEPLEREVLPFAYAGSPGRTRTSDQVVNSHPLCRLSYRGTKTSRHSSQS
jgi:site-specific DNA recombinase